MKVLIIGLGSIARKHISSLKRLDDTAEIYALRSAPDSQNLNGINNIYSYEEIQSLRPDFAIISNPTYKHKSTIERLAGFNIPLFIEKPVHSDLSIESLSGEILSKGIATYIACNLRFLECINYVKYVMDPLRMARLNEVNIYCGSYLPGWRPDIDFRNSYSAIKENGGGVHLDLIHEIDYAYWIFGKPLNNTRILKNKSTLGISSCDYASYILEYDNFCVSIILNYYRRDPVRRFELVFDDSTWTVNLLNNTIFSDDKIIFSSDRRIIDTYYNQMTYFVNSVLKGEKSFNDISSAIEVLKICLPV